MNSSEVLFLVLQSFSFGERLWYRRVCKAWKEAIDGGELLSRLIFTLDRHPNATEAFLSLSPSLKVRHFRFANVNLDCVFQELVQRDWARIESIFLINCVLSGGKFLELISHCPRLTHLGIQHSPSIYQVNMAALHWEFDLKSVIRNLGGLKILELRENDIPEKDFHGLTWGMRSLSNISISVENACSSLPHLAIINLLRNNCATLRGLLLHGRLFPNISIPHLIALEEFPEFNVLSQLVINRGYLHSMPHSMILESLFQKCPNLSQLMLSDASLELRTMTHVGDNLVVLELGDITFDSASMRTLRVSRLKTLRIVQQKDDIPVRTEEAILDILNNDLFHLAHLELALVSGGRSIIKELAANACLPSLRCLSLSGFDCTGRYGWSGVFNKFENLEELSIINSMSLEDDCLCPEIPGNDEEGSLAKLTKLRYLNLSGTRVSNQTIQDCVMFYKGDLEVLKLAFTQVDNEGLTIIMEGVRSELLSKLGYLDLTGSACQLSEEQHNILMVHIYPRCVTLVLNTV